MAMNEDDITRALYKSCAEGDHPTLCHLLDSFPYTMKLLDLTNRLDPPKTLVEKTLYTSCLKGHYKVSKELLRSNVNPNSICEFGTPIYAAVSAGSLEIVKLLIDYKADYKRVRGGFSPLFAACVVGNLKILKYLVNVGADLYFFTNPPLVFTACMQGHLHILEYLMDEMEYDIHRTINGEDAIRMEGKDSLLYVACSSKQVEIASHLLTRCAIITPLIISKFSTIVKELLERRIKTSSRPPAQQGLPPSTTARWKELGLAELPWSFLSGKSQVITKLELHSNRLTSLPDEIFQMPNLKVLDISQNLLSEISIEEVEWKCTSLTDINLTKNQIAYVPSGLFLCPKLTSINLSYNLLQRLPGDTEDACPNVVWRCDLLKKLDLSHNRLRALPDSFKGLKRLNTLVISYNYLNELPTSCTLGCINLVHLDAAHNSLKELPYGAANYWMHCLERLYLSHNEFDEISRCITELSHLTTLDLSHNRISILPHTTVWTNTKMNRLSLAYNNITTLTHRSEDDQTYTKSGSSRHTGANDRRRTPTGWNTMRLFGGRNKRNEEAASTGGANSQTSDGIPRELPVEKWSMSLQSLYLQNNQVRFLPDYIGQLVGLSRLDVSNNASIHCLPLTYGRLKNCWELIMHGLDITNVPKHLLPGIGRGASTKQLIAYLKGQLKNSRPYNRMKLMAVGLQGRGKTTLLSVLRDSNAPLPPNVSTVGVNVHEWVIHPPKQRGLSQRQQLDVVFSAWDLAGQEVYYATHQCFLSRNTLYLLVWNMSEGEKGIEYLRPWLLNIQARAPYSPVIIVGTHLDKVHPSKIPELKKIYGNLITKQYDNDGYPTISDICMVSSVTKEGIKDLQERIHSAALNAKDPDTHEHVIGMQVPSSYIDLQKLVEIEAKRCHEVGKPPVLSQKEFATLAGDTGDITDPEELSLAANFLHDNGIILHYNDYLKGLNNLYFIDPVWLADMLAHIITVPQKQNFVHNGILRETHLKFIFRGNRQYPENYLAQYMQLLERFEIALSLGQGALLIPSMLPEARPALPFATPLPRPRHNTTDDPVRVRKSTIKQGSIAEADVITLNNVPKTYTITKIIEGEEVVNTKVTCVRRRLCMAYIPSGFWSRLISRLIINLKRSGLTDNQGRVLGQNIAYWRRGLLASHPSGKFLVESVQSMSTEVSGVAISDNMLQSCKFVGDALDSKCNIIQGVDVTVWSDCDDFSAMGYVVDQLDSLIDEWFPGLNELDIEGDWLIERQALWVVPPELKRILKPAMTEDEEESYDTAFIDPLDQDVFIFRLEDCALKALLSDNIMCSEYNVLVPLSHIVPDLLLSDLPKDLIIDTSLLEFNPKDPSTRLGRGGAGAVYRGKYRNENVAIKEFLTQSQADSGYDEYDELGGQQPQQSQHDDSISAGEALFLFRDMRQEVTVLAQLSHPNIVSLLGVSLRPMCICLELAPMGSLFGILDKKLEAMKQSQADLPSTIIRMPGGVLGHEISARIALQVALALRYLHKNGIVYRDLKSDNVLIWSLNVDASVNAKLADYGISRFANPGGIKGEEGTPGYMAPEAIKRRGEDQAFDEKVDVFAFGMLLFELLTGQRPFETLTSGQEVNRAVIERERPQIQDGNCEPCFPSMVELMEDSWRHLASQRPTANEVVNRIVSPGFLSRRHCITRIRDHPLLKLDVVYAQPPVSEDVTDLRNSTMWLWSQQDTERKYSTMDVRRGVFMLPEKSSPGGRVYAMGSTGEVEKRVWVATSVSKNYPDFEIQVYGYKPNGEPECLWSFIVKDSVLDVTTEVRGGRVQRVFASLANGTICIFYRKSICPNLPKQFGDAVIIEDACKLKCEKDQHLLEARDWENPYILTLSEGIRAFAVKYMTFVGTDQIWCACGNTISVVDVVNLKVISSFNVFVRRNQLVNELVSNGKKVWGIGRHLSCVMEWDAKTQKLVTIFDCGRIDPTGSCLKGDPSTVEELSGTVANTRITSEESTPSHSPLTDRDDDDLANDSGSLTTSASPKEHDFQVLNEPQDPSRLTNTSRTYMSRGSTLKTTFHRRRKRAMNMSMEPEKGIFAPRPEIDAQHRARIRSHLRMQGATRTTSLLYVQDVLWIARGMGDVLIVNVSETDNHGIVMARFSSEDSHKYGNKSTHKLCQVGSNFVVSSQWLEPLEMARPRSNTVDSSVVQNTPVSYEPLLTAHQQITVWKAWDQSRVELYNQKISHTLQLDKPDY